jgi:hypothetical protein
MRKKKRQKHKTSKKAADTLDMHAGHIFRPLAAFFSPLPPVCTLVLCTVDRLGDTLHRGKKMRIPARAGYFYSMDGVKRKTNSSLTLFSFPIASPISSRHVERDLERSSAICDSLLRNTPG